MRWPKLGLRVSVADEGELDSLMDATTYRETFLGD